MSSPTHLSSIRRKRKLQTRNRLAEKERFLLEVKESGVPKEHPCDHCQLFDLPCLVMPRESRSLKCAECFRNGVVCESKSWSSLDHTRKKYRDAIRSSQKERDDLLARLLEVQSRLARDEKILSLAEEEAKGKFWCLARQLEEDGEDIFAAASEANLLETELFGPLSPGTLAHMDLSGFNPSAAQTSTRNGTAAPSG